MALALKIPICIAKDYTVSKKYLATGKHPVPVCPHERMHICPVRIKGYYIFKRYSTILTGAALWAGDNEHSCHQVRTKPC